MTTTNRMKPRTIQVPDNVETTVLGLGCEGVINGARVAALTINCTGIAAVVHVLRLYRRATSSPSDEYAPFSGPTNLTANIANSVDLSDIDGYDIKATLTQASGAATAPVVSWSTTR